ncbi:unnamed protein product [Eretmochelys imbricata]
MWLGEGWAAHPQRPRGLLSYQLIARGSAATFRVTGHRQRELHFPAQSPGQQAQSRPFLRRAARNVMSWRCLAQTDKHPVVWKAEVLLNVLQQPLSSEPSKGLPVPNLLPMRARSSVPGGPWRLLAPQGRSALQ